MTFEISNLTELDWTLGDQNKKAILIDRHKDAAFNKIYENITYRQVTDLEADKIALKYNIVGFPTLLVHKALNECSG